MDMRRLVILSFGVKFLISSFFIAFLWMHHLISQSLFSRTASFNRIHNELKEGADVNARSKSVFERLSGLTPLMQAASWGDLRRVRLLLKFGADVNLRAENRQGDMALHMAVRNAQAGNFYNVMKILELLLDKSNVNKKNNYGDTPLHAALDIIMENKRKKVVDLLIKHKADINAQNDNGNTHMHLAVQRILTYYVTWFLKKYGSCVNPNLKNKDEYTILSLAKRYGYYSLTRAVKEGLFSVKAR